MIRYVVGPGVALVLAEQEAEIRDGIELLAPTLMRSELLDVLYQSVRAGRITRAEAARHLEYVRRLRIRLLGDRVLQATALRFAEELELPSTFGAEYIALTRLQADALVTTDAKLAAAAARVVAVATIDDVT